MVKVGPIQRYRYFRAAVHHVVHDAAAEVGHVAVELRLVHGGAVTFDEAPGVHLIVVRLVATHHVHTLDEQRQPREQEHDATRHVEPRGRDRRLAVHGSEPA